MKHFLIVLMMFILLLSAPAAQARQRPDAPTYAQRGPYPVGTLDLVIADDERPLNVTVWYPALNPDEVEEATIYQVGIFQLPGEAIRDAAPDAEHGPYPLVVFSHGLGGLRVQSRFFTEHLASYGFVVIAADHPGSTLFELATGGGIDAIIANYAYRPGDLLREIDFAGTLTAAGGALEGTIDIDRVAVSGHSFGGYTALAAGGARLDFDALDAWCEANGAGPADFGALAQSHIEGQTDEVSAACFLREHETTIATLRGLESPPEGVWPPTTDPRIRAALLFAPWNGPAFGRDGLAALTVPAMVVVGSEDRATIPERDAYPIYEGIGSVDRALVVLENAGHYVFVDRCPDAAVALGMYDRCTDLVWDMDRAHDLINHFGTAFLLATLNGDTAAAQALAPDVIDFVGVDYATSGVFGESNPAPES